VCVSADRTFATKWVRCIFFVFGRYLFAFVSFSQFLSVSV